MFHTKMHHSFELPKRFINPIPEKKKIAPRIPYTARTLNSPEPLTYKTAVYIKPPIPNRVSTKPSIFLISMGLKIHNFLICPAPKYFLNLL